MNTLDGLLHGIVEDPRDGGRWLILADWLDEHNDPRRAELLRLHRRLLATCCEPEQHPERAEQQARLVDLLGQGVKPCVSRQTLSLGGGIEMTFNFIPPGTFLMGSPTSEEQREDDEGPQHRVTLTKGFWLGSCPVMQAQWQEIVGDNPSQFQGHDDLPVEAVSWDDCMAFCERLGEKTGKRFRLPTEAEWEYACRAGTTTPFHFGETISTDQANYDGNYPYAGKEGVYRKKTTPVGSFPPNAWGLFDLHGNVFEWCQDWYGNYSQKDQKDPVGDDNGNAHVLRGGSWFFGPGSCRSAYRLRDDSGVRYGFYGCRVLLYLG